MNGALYIIYGSILIPLFIMSVYLLKGKGASLIAGYNTMSNEEKAKYDEKALCRFVGWLLIAIIFCMAFIPLGTFFEIAFISYFGIAILFIVPIGGIIYANTGNRFHKPADLNTPADYNNQNLNSKNKVTVFTVIPISVIILILVGLMLYHSEKDPDVVIHEHSLQIKAMYGLNVDFSDVTNISLIDKSISDIGIGRRFNGYGGFGETLKGNFKSEQLGETLLFVQKKSSPTILIKQNDKKDIYISFRNNETTRTIYNEIITVFSSNYTR